MTFELIQSDYYEELGKTNFAKDLREENYDEIDWTTEFIYYNLGVGGDRGYVGDDPRYGTGFIGDGGRANIGGCNHIERQSVGDNKEKINY